MQHVFLSDSVVLRINKTPLKKIQQSSVVWNDRTHHLWNGNVWSMSNHSEWRFQNEVKVVPILPSKTTNTEVERKLLVRGFPLSCICRNQSNFLSVITFVPPLATVMTSKLRSSHQSPLNTACIAVLATKNIPKVNKLLRSLRLFPVP
jgi:hypothetical protein